MTRLLIFFLLFQNLHLRYKVFSFTFALIFDLIGFGLMFTLNTQSFCDVGCHYNHDWLVIIGVIGYMMVQELVMDVEQ